MKYWSKVLAAPVLLAVTLLLIVALSPAIQVAVAQDNETSFVELLHQIAAEHPNKLVRIYRRDQYAQGGSAATGFIRYFGSDFVCVVDERQTYGDGTYGEDCILFDDISSISLSAIH